MVVTRRAGARRSQPGTPAGGGGGSPTGVESEPAGAGEMAAAELCTPVSVRMTRRRTRSICKPDVIQESQLEELEHAETKSNVGDSLEVEMTRNENATVHSVQSVAEPQADGDVSEAESNCSAASGLQTPLFIRVTRRRKIVVPYQPDSPDKRRYKRTAFLNKLNGIPDEDDVSEAESCSSIVTRTTRSRRSKKGLQPDTVHEAQSEDISDADSCCLSSHMEPSITNRRVTRSMEIKSEAEHTKQAEKGNIIVSEDENLTEDTVKSEPGISDSRPAAELVSDTEDASPVTEGNEEPSSPKSKCSFKSANTTQGEGMKEESLHDVTPSSLTEMKQSDSESPEKRAIKNTQSVGADDSEEARGQVQENYSKVLVRVEKLEHMNFSDSVSPKQFLEFQGQITLDKDKKDPECKREGAEADPQQPFTHAGNLGKDEQATEVRSPQKDEAVAQGTDSVSGCRMLESSEDSAEDQAGEYAKPVPHCSEIPSSENNSLALFLAEDESDEFEDSAVADTDKIEENLYYKEADKTTPSLSKSLETSSLDAEGLFVIDTKPGISSDRKYYLDQIDQGSDAESKHEGSKKSEESSDLEEAEEELIDEDEKEEDDDLLKNKTDVLCLSTSIDPGLNIKKLGGLYISFDAENQKSKLGAIKQLKEKQKDQLLQKSVITPDFEKKECVPPYRESLHQLKKQRRAEREKTTGDSWFGMKAPEITTELKNDLKVLKMRASLDPKHFYKKNDRDGLPKYFQVGTVVDSPIDFYHSRIPKKQRKRTIVEELLADSEFRRYNKKKYQEIMSEKAAFAAGKRNRKKKKFHN
ncbi:deoxynucleotidyltransferase terminal-interacting protein 2 [Neopsephotus bourkii]|uniref:deoxynucleotidyltransferase terminal-interacting protein 2 n=1 Tax=Neopsephotus bourkii TaxID=309878 RepID=UPI002AA5594B|nr:deoxynucleotidyltransferase terminal-interacting protein 2 [Neopsephotus bourkii]